MDLCRLWVRSYESPPTDRGKPGTKRSVIADEEGGPLGTVIEGAIVHDTKLLEATLEAVVVERSEPTQEEPQNLCLNKGYDNSAGREAAAKHKYTPPNRKIGEEKAISRQEPAQAAPLGRGTDLGMAFEVPRDSRALGQECIQLPRPDSTRLRSAVVPTAPPHQHRIGVLRSYLNDEARILAISSQPSS